MATELDIRNALASLKGPDGTTPFLRSGVLGGIAIQGEKVYVSLLSLIHI